MKKISKPTQIIALGVQPGHNVSKWQERIHFYALINYQLHRAELIYRLLLTTARTSRDQYKLPFITQ